MTNSHNNLQYPFNRLASIRRRYTSFEFFKQDPSQTIHVAYIMISLTYRDRELFQAQNVMENLMLLIN